MEHHLPEASKGSSFIIYATVTELTVTLLLSGTQQVLYDIGRDSHDVQKMIQLGPDCTCLKRPFTDQQSWQRQRVKRKVRHA